MADPLPEKSNSSQGVAPRAVAARVLAHVLGQRRPLDETLDNEFTKQRMGDADRRLVHAICGFVFRNLPAIDRLLLGVMNRKRAPSPVLLHQLLRVGVAQLLFMEVPAHAAVHATVSACGSLHLSRQKSLVNAVLRAVQRQKDAGGIVTPDALELLPGWMAERWSLHYGESAARMVAGAMHREAPVDITLKAPHASLEWAQKLQGEALLAGSVRVHQGAGQITSWAGFEEGAWWVQDLAASLPVRLLGDVADKSVLDMCAAPGGKTMQLAAGGARVTALDSSVSRLDRVTENLQRITLAERVTIASGDARHWRTDTAYDAILLDAPCTSSGTLRRHPELPWIHSQNDIQKMTVVQRDLLRHAAEMLRPGGILLYCTCSMEPEEGENQVEGFLTERKDFRELRRIPDDLNQFLSPGLRGIGFRTFPAMCNVAVGMDGFFMAQLQRQ